MKAPSSYFVISTSGTSIPLQIFTTDNISIAKKLAKKYLEKEMNIVVNTIAESTSVLPIVNFYTDVGLLVLKRVGVYNRGNKQ